MLVLNGTPVTLPPGTSPTMTLLDWLRGPARSPAPRKAAPRAIAAPAPWCWNSRTATRADQCLPGDARPVARHGGAHGGRPARRRTAARIRCSTRWPRAMPPNAASARRASPCRPVRACGAKASSRGARGAGGQPLPLHRLPPDHRGVCPAEDAEVTRARAARRRRATFGGRGQLPSPGAAGRACSRCAPASRGACCSPAAPISACWPASSRKPPAASSACRLCRSCRRSATTAGITIGAASPMRGPCRLLDARLSGARAHARPAGLAADPHPGHDRRQFRHRLAHRRHAAAAAGPRGLAAARLSARGRATMRSRISSWATARRRWRRTRYRRPSICPARPQARCWPATRSRSGATRTSRPWRRLR